MICRVFHDNDKDKSTMQGLEVDYIVHVATCIAHSPVSGRAGVTFALRTMGMSIVSGYTTSVGAALFLLPCEMGVFTQFGTMLTYSTLATVLRSKLSMVA